MGPWSNRNDAVYANALEMPNRVAWNSDASESASDEDCMRLRTGPSLRHRRAASTASPTAARDDDSLERVMAELSHDLRQPLTSLRMNLQSAVKLLQQPTPRVTTALEALADCFDTERDMTELVSDARRRFATLAKQNGGGSRGD